ncbi:hypothetical protein Y032_0047g1525 [Ancylostoma ceylanicum]|uniref:Uncharacterized protein n=1 Tax=Ancylostoma ceylanicum TaxID=53326 RepID=A0A016UCH1_9BILA|nr:hypothetical protein Y032_0047g1525 [Ancylostoma ceylanicum]
MRLTIYFNPNGLPGSEYGCFINDGIAIAKKVLKIGIIVKIHRGTNELSGNYDRGVNQCATSSDELSCCGNSELRSSCIPLRFSCVSAAEIPGRFFSLRLSACEFFS